MNDKFPERKWNKLLSALPELAKQIGMQTQIYPSSLKRILAPIDMARDNEALRELETWSTILQRVHAATDDTATNGIVDDLKARGIPEFQAILAVDAAKGQPLSAEPDRLEFGQLNPDEGTHATIKVTGGPVKVQVRNRLLKVTLADLGSGVTLLKVQVSRAPSGKSLQDDIIVKGSKGELRIPVSAQWKGTPPDPNKSTARRQLPREYQEFSSQDVCPKCNKGTLFWDGYIRGYVCSNMWCLASGPSKDNLIKIVGKRKWW